MDVPAEYVCFCRAYRRPHDTTKYLIYAYRCRSKQTDGKMQEKQHCFELVIIFFCLQLAKTCIAWLPTSSACSFCFMNMHVNWNKYTYFHIYYLPVPRFPKDPMAQKWKPDERKEVASMSFRKLPFGSQFKCKCSVGGGAVAADGMYAANAFRAYVCGAHELRALIKRTRLNGVACMSGQHEN